MAIVSKAQRKRRRCVAFERLNSGIGVSEVNRTLVRDYGITRRSANLDINWASAQIVKNLKGYEKTDLMGWLITQSERVYLKALETIVFINSVTNLCITKLDVLDGFEEIQVCIDYDKDQLPIYKFFSGLTHQNQPV
mgnify:CR=1 FL=1